MFNKIATAVLLLSLAACAARHPRPVPLPEVPAQARLQSLPPPGEYAIDSNESELRLFVYRAGPLANLGHNHVMVNRAVTGAVRIGTGVATSSFSLRMRASDFEID